MTPERSKLILSEFLLQQNGFIKEYDLLSYLQLEHKDFFSELGEEPSLYKKHFLLFHYLYQLASDFSKENITLEISVLSIGLRASSNNGKNLTCTDELGEFYRNREHLKLSEKEVAQMINEFWGKYYAIEKRANALIVFSLESDEAVDIKKIKRRYRQLAQTHHPDKGGDELTFRKITEAYDDLKKLFG